MTEQDTDALLARAWAYSDNRTGDSDARKLVNDLLARIEALQSENLALAADQYHSTLLADRTEELKMSVELTEFWIDEHHKAEARLTAALAANEALRGALERSPCPFPLPEAEDRTVAACLKAHVCGCENAGILAALSQQPEDKEGEPQ